MDPITAGLITNVIGSAFKPKAQYNPMMQHQMAAMNAKKSYIPYFNDLIKQGSGLQKSYLPKAQKMADMSMENAVKPLSDTDLFKGIGPMAAVLQRQGDAVTSNAANVASQRASGMANQGTGMMQNGIQGAQGAWNDFGETAGAIGAQQLQAQQMADAQHAQLMNMLSSFWGNQLNNQQFNKNLAAAKAQNAETMKSAPPLTSTPVTSGSGGSNAPTGIKSSGAYGGR
jgi:hypothetical protein